MLPNVSAPAAGGRSRLAAAPRQAGLVLAGVALIAASAQINVPMYPVPVTLQTLVVLALGAVGGWRYGAAAAGGYLAAGLVGLPVFAQWAAAPGAAFLALKTGGYVLGFLPAAALVGALAARQRGSLLRLAGVMLLGHAVVFAFGVPWLAAFVGWTGAVAFGLTPFLWGSLVKSALGAALIVAAGRLRRALG
mgnify:FL=1